MLLRTCMTWLLGAAAAGPVAAQVSSAASPPAIAPPIATPNDNRRPAGTTTNDTLTLKLDAMWAGWRPDDSVDSAATVRAFAERGAAPSIPGPLLRVGEGTAVRLVVRNLLGDSAITLRAPAPNGTGEATLRLAPGEERELHFLADSAGTYLYWAGTDANGTTIGDRWGRDGLLTGAIVVDPAGEPPLPDRIFVLTMIDIFADSSRPPTSEDVWELAINGRSWPFTERIAATVGDTLRWRWVNGTFRGHPMHLHGFHFSVGAVGLGGHMRRPAPGAVPLAVTHLVRPGGSIEIAWSPTRPGNWLMHCHMKPHITPYPERAANLRHAVHTGAENAGLRHAEDAMAGLVLGITTTGVDRDQPATATRSLRLYIQESGDSGAVPRGFVLETGARPAHDSVVVPALPLVLVRGEPTAIMVVNRLSEPTSVHWHGIEIRSVFDGVAGWSGDAGGLAPLIAPGDSFAVAIAAPRAGTYMFHTHMDEEAQLSSGLYGPLIVLEPGDSLDPVHDLITTIGEIAQDGGYRPAINGQAEPPPRRLRAGTRYRLRFVQILPTVPVDIRLVANGEPVTWVRIGKDGAATPDAARRAEPANLRVGVGETYDFEWIAESPATLEIELPGGLGVVRQEFGISPPDGPPQRRVH